MADKRRFSLFARFLVEKFAAPRIFDVAGGQGRLNQELTLLGRQVTTFDRKHKHLPVAYAERIFTLEEPCACDLVVGLHSDGATRVIIDYAVDHRVPFAIVPCCADNGMSYKPWLRFLAEHARAADFIVDEALLPMEGRARVIFGAPGKG